MVLTKSEKKYIIYLNAIISNEISPLKKSKRSIVFIFKDIGKITLDQNGKLIEASYSRDLENRIQMEFLAIHQKVEEAIRGIKEISEIQTIMVRRI